VPDEDEFENAGAERELAEDGTLRAGRRASTRVDESATPV